MSDVVRPTLCAQGNIRGSFTLKGDLALTGSFTGSVTVTGELTIGEDARVRGKVASESLIVAGRFDGEAQAAGRVTLRNGASFSGKLVCASLLIDEGAKLEGQVLVGLDPVSKTGGRGQGLAADSNHEDGAAVAASLSAMPIDLTSEPFDATIEVQIDRETADDLEPRVDPLRVVTVHSGNSSKTDPHNNVKSDHLRKVEIKSGEAAADAPALPEVRIGSAALHSALLRRRTKVLIGATAKPPLPPESSNQTSQTKLPERKTS